MSTPKLRIGYVREHFSSPLLQLAEKDQTIELVECPSTFKFFSLLAFPSFSPLSFGIQRSPLRPSKVLTNSPSCRWYRTSHVSNQVERNRRRYRIDRISSRWYRQKDRRIQARRYLRYFTSTMGSHCREGFEVREVGRSQG